MALNHVRRGVRVSLGLQSECQTGVTLIPPLLRAGRCLLET
jgi:hypothetical protein